jgi:hypothetical protein
MKKCNDLKRCIWRVKYVVVTTFDAIKNACLQMGHVLTLHKDNIVQYCNIYRKYEYI